MKELSIEEKARRYDEAIKLAKDSYNYPSYPGFIRADVVFPELKESEDERIRKTLKEYFINSFQDNGVAAICGVHIKDILAWLEKQGKNNMGISEATKKKLEDSLNEALGKETPESWNKFLDEQGEQKPVAWSEEDEKILNLIIARLHSHPNVEFEEYGKDYHWLNSLEDRVQPKQEWSEEDRKKIIELVGIFESAVDGYTANFPYRLLKDYIRILKSCIPQSTWKPSEEQMKALNYYIKYNVDSDGVFGSQLVKLYQDLKKLKD